MMSNVNSFHSSVSVASSTFSTVFSTDLVSLTSEAGDKLVFKNESIAHHSPSPDICSILNFELEIILTKKLPFATKQNRKSWRCDCWNLTKNNQNFLKFSQIYKSVK